MKTNAHVGLREFKPFCFTFLEVQIVVQNITTLILDSFPFSCSIDMPLGL